MLRRSSADLLRTSGGTGGASAGAVGSQAAVEKSAMRRPSGVSRMCSGFKSLEWCEWGLGGGLGRGCDGGGGGGGDDSCIRH